MTGSYEALAGLVTFRPLERPIAEGRERSQFSAPWVRTVKDLARELRMIEARGAVMQVDFREQDFRLDGLPRSGRSARSPAVVLTFEAEASGPVRYEVGRYRTFEENVRALALTLEALRSVDRYGITKRGEQYAGWRALPAGRGNPDAERGRQIVEGRYDGSVRRALKGTHPDHGGDGDDFADVRAYQEAG